jgi:outer membrane protein OmpA-like peptidoglycan-associated protein
MICVLGLAALPLSLAAPESAAVNDIYIEAEENLGADLDMPSPPVTFRIRRGDDPAAFFGDHKTILHDILRWQLQIFDFDNKKTTFLQDSQAPASDQLPWDGMARNGSPLPDGFYTARFVWTDSQGAAHKSKPIRVGLLTPSALRAFAGPHVRIIYSDDALTIRLAEELAFTPGDWRINPKALPTLDKISDFLQTYPKHRMLIQGHADPTGAHAANQLVSANRAYSIYRFLAEHGVDPSRMDHAGLGASQPIANSSTAEGRMKNRRVDIRLLKAES